MIIQFSYDAFNHRIIGSIYLNQERRAFYGGVWKIYAAEQLRSFWNGACLNRAAKQPKFSGSGTWFDCLIINGLSVIVEINKQRRGKCRVVTNC